MESSARKESIVLKTAQVLNKRVVQTSYLKSAIYFILAAGLVLAFYFIVLV